MDPFSASSLYGGQPSPQPTGTPGPDGPPNTPEPVARTTPRDSDDARGDPLTWYVMLLGAAIAFGFLSAHASGGVAASGSVSVGR
jgi:hypothetical protein